jgi:hypothetical protein
MDRVRPATTGNIGEVEMKLASRRRWQLAALAVIGLGSTVGARAATDPSFLLTATAKDFASYFPGQLGNGYLSTLTAPRGTEGNLAYLVAFMDYAQGDIARPAAVPGWSEIDYSTGNSPAGHFWLNQAALDPAVFQDYRQQLNMYEGTLTTRYRYLDHGRATRIEDDGLAEAYAPVLPPGWKSLTLRHVTFRGKRYDIRIDRGADGKAKLTRTAI